MGSSGRLGPLLRWLCLSGWAGPALAYYCTHDFCQAREQYCCGDNICCSYTDPYWAYYLWIAFFLFLLSAAGWLLFHFVFRFVFGAGQPLPDWNRIF